MIYRIGLYGAEHSKCYRMMTLGYKGLSVVCTETVNTRCRTTCLDTSWLANMTSVADDAWKHIKPTSKLD